MSESKPASGSFSIFLRSCFREAMVDVVGESGANAIMFHLKLGDTPYDPEKIDGRLVDVFNKVGARVIERQVLKRLFDEMGERYEDRDDLSFAKQIDMAENEWRNTVGRVV